MKDDSKRKNQIKEINERYHLVHSLINQYKSSVLGRKLLLCDIEENIGRINNCLEELKLDNLQLIDSLKMSNKYVQDVDIALDTILNLANETGNHYCSRQIIFNIYGKHVNVKNSLLLISNKYALEKIDNTKEYDFLDVNIIIDNIIDNGSSVVAYGKDLFWLKYDNMSINPVEYDNYEILDNPNSIKVFSNIDELGNAARAFRDYGAINGYDFRDMNKKELLNVMKRYKKHNKNDKQKILKKHSH